VLFYSKIINQCVLVPVFCVYFHNALHLNKNQEHPYVATGNLPQLVCGPRLVTGARLLSVQMNQTPGLYAGTVLRYGISDSDTDLD